MADSGNNLKAAVEDYFAELRRIRFAPPQWPSFLTPLTKKQESRLSSSSGANQKAEITHLSLALIRCYESGTSLWSQPQGRDGNTYYKTSLPAKDSTLAVITEEAFFAPI